MGRDIRLDAVFVVAVAIAAFCGFLVASNVRLGVLPATWFGAFAGAGVAIALGVYEVVEAFNALAIRGMFTPAVAASGLGYQILQAALAFVAALAGAVAGAWWGARRGSSPWQSRLRKRSGR